MDKKTLKIKKLKLRVRAYEAYIRQLEGQIKLLESKSKITVKYLACIKCGDPLDRWGNHPNRHAYCSLECYYVDYPPPPVGPVENLEDLEDLWSPEIKKAADKVSEETLELLRNYTKFQKETGLNPHVQRVEFNQWLGGLTNADNSIDDGH